MTKHCVSNFKVIVFTKTMRKKDILQEFFVCDSIDFTLLVVADRRG